MKPHLPSESPTNRMRQDGQHDRGADVGARDHRLAADGVEQAPEQQRADEVRDREQRQVQRDDAVLDLVEGDEERAEAEGDRVVDEGLADEQREAEEGALRVGLEGRRGDLAQRDRLPLADRDRRARLVERLVGLLGDLALDAVDDPLGLLLAAVDEQPARALGHVPAHEQDADAEDRAEAEGEAPAQVDREDVHEQHVGAERAERRAEPVGAVDDQVDAAAHARRDQLVDGGVDRGVLAADAGSGEEAADHEQAPRST